MRAPKGRYVARPPLALDRLKQRKDGKILLTLKLYWFSVNRTFWVRLKRNRDRLEAVGVARGAGAGPLGRSPA
jgi:hypothetical protein